MNTLFQPMHCLWSVCDNHWLFIFIFRLIVHKKHCKLKRFGMIRNKTMTIWICPLIKGRNNIYIKRMGNHFGWNMIISKWDRDILSIAIYSSVLLEKKPIYALYVTFEWSEIVMSVSNQTITQNIHTQYFMLTPYIDIEMNSCKSVCFRFSSVI